MLIVGISGKAGTGKTTMANDLGILCGHMPVMAFADTLKDEVARVYNIDRWALDEDKNRLHSDPLLPKSPMTLREIMQYHGQARRDEDPGHWVRALDNAVRTRCDGLPVVIVHDVRYPDEAEWVMDHRGLLIRLEPYPGWKPGEFSGHISETALDGWPAWDIQARPRFGWLECLSQDVVMPEITRRVCEVRG